ncbi:MAG: DoxX family protein [Acidobacteria bacterium]|nr:DoxX family protein [Acidobacteriota bacterium]MBA4184418.1 DoxX family protein [Acidobacteriota bacterium]
MKVEQSRNFALIFLRITVALLMLIHGIARIYFGIVDDFGEFLTLNNFPLGFYLAWAITSFEIVGSVLLAIGRYVAPLAIIFAVHLLCGILLVHLKEGWFVVGAGKNGAEYSVLLIAVFITLAVSHFGKIKN